MSWWLIALLCLAEITLLVIESGFKSPEWLKILTFLCFFPAAYFLQADVEQLFVLSLTGLLTCILLQIGKKEG